MAGTVDSDGLEITDGRDTRTTEFSQASETLDDSIEQCDIPGHSELRHEQARLFGELNILKKSELKAKLRQFRLDPEGKVSVLKKRLKCYYKKRQSAMAKARDPKSVNFHYQYLMVIDFEATCQADVADYRHEIIEFPAVLLNVQDRCFVAKFHSYVRPVVNPKLTEFCSSLTGITQEQVNASPHFPEVVQHFEDWLSARNLLEDQPDLLAVVTDGPWDMGRFMLMQCRESKIPFPNWAKRWINIRKSFSNFYDTRRLSLQEMLSFLGMTFKGQPHCGMDDSLNIARIAVKLLSDGANLRVNERVLLDNKVWPGLTLSRQQKTVRPITRDEFDRMLIRKHGGLPLEKEEDESSESEGATYGGEGKGNFDVDFPALTICDGNV